MSRQLITALIIGVVALAAGFLWWGDGATPDSPPGGTAKDSQLAAAERATAVESATGALDRPSAAADAVPEGLFRTEVETGPPPSYLTIQVWDREEGVAAARADVFVLDDLYEGDVDWSFTEGPFAQHWSSAAERQGRRFRTDDDGRVEVANVKGNAVVAARQPGAYAFKWVGGDREQDRVEMLTLHADETVTVRVVDQQDRRVPDAAVGIIQRVPVLGSVEELTARMRELEGWMEGIRKWMDANPDEAVEAADKLNWVRREYGGVRREVDAAKRHRDRNGIAAVQRPATRVEVRTRRRTDENGLAVIEHFQLYRQGEGKGGDKGKGGELLQPPSPQFEAALLMPLQQPVTSRFSADALPDDVIELRMPATGSVALRTVDRDGRPFTHPVHGELRVESDDPAAWTRVMLRKEQNERTIEFQHVGLGLTFAATCRLDDNDFRWQAPGFQGPVAEGERVEVDLVVAPAAGMLHARLVDGGGTALAGLEPTFLINSAGGRLEGEQVITDDEGCFHLPYKVRPDQLAPYRFEIRRDDVSPTMGLALRLVALPQATVTDLGDLTVDALGEIAHGVVVDDAGEPIAKANVQLQRERPVGGDGGLRFVDEAFVRTETDDEGRFALFGAPESANYRLRAEAKDHFPGQELLRVGGQPHRLQLTRKCRVVGTVLAPEWMVRERVRVELTPVSVQGAPEGEVKPRSDQIHDYEGKTYAYFDWVRAGTYDLAFRLQGFSDAFLRVDSLVIEPGQVDLHPRLRDLDLGAYIYRFEIHPVDPNGQPVEVDRPTLTMVTRANGEQQFVGLVMKGSYGEVFSTTSQLEVFPMCEGYVADRQVLAAGRSEIVYRAIPPVDLVLGGLGAMAGDVSVQVVLERLELDGLPEQLEAFDGMSERISGWYARAKYSAAMLDARDTARVAVTAGGPHKVILRFGVGQTRPTVVELDAVQVDITPGGQSLRVAVPFDAQVAQQAIADAAQQIRQGQGRESRLK